MGTYQSKYTGAEIDELLDRVNGGGTGGGSYTETELLSEPVTYAQSTTSNTSAINQDLVLLDDVTNYDEIVINYCSGATNSSQRYTNTEHRILVSNIVYNNSDSAINARELIILQLTMQVMRFMTIWFRTPNTIRISNTRSEGNVPTGNFFEVFSIKGIKY